jgi:iduronate 2-sulfatase
MHRRDFLKMMGAAAGSLCLGGCGRFVKGSAGAKRSLNVLLILVDDLKPTLGCYGDSVAKTPNIDRLASLGMRFDKAYCNQAVCAPSRYNLMLGSRSSSLGLYNLGQSFRDVYPDAVTVSQYFIRNGWRAESVGKVFHVGHGNPGDPVSWSEPPHYEPVVEYRLPENSAGGQLTREEAYFTNQQLDRIGSLPRGNAWENADVPDEAYSDGRIATEGIRRLRAAKERSEPLFLALGFVKPHLPFCAPKKYWDLYDPAAFELAARPTAPEGAPDVASKGLIEIDQYEPVSGQNLKDPTLQRQLIHGYYASTSYADAQIGRVLDELDRLGLTEETIIVLWGDNGYHLGDLGYWTKHTNYEQANRIPLIIAAPGAAKPGSHTAQLTETVDIYPTLAELAGLPRPVGPQPIDGLSLVPVLRDPGVRLRDHAYHAFPRGKRIGRAIRTDRYRLVEWKIPNQPSDRAVLELYDYQTDPLETRNLASERPEIVAELRAILARHPEAVPQR